MFGTYSTFWKIIDYLFPPQCAGCGVWGSRFCLECIQDIETFQDSICEICGNDLNLNKQYICDNCTLYPPHFSAIGSAGIYKGVLKKAIQKLKYDKDIALSETLANLLLDVIRGKEWNINLITCVPLDQKRYRERGYNQSSLLAGTLANISGLPYSEKAIIRLKETRSQVGLSREERINNVASVFSANKKMVSGKIILLVDDVITTGATINSCAEALIFADAAMVFGVTLARAKRLLEE